MVLIKAIDRVARHLLYARATPGNYRVIATRIIAIITIARRPLEIPRHAPLPHSGLGTRALVIRSRATWRYGAKGTRVPWAGQ